MSEERIVIVNKNDEVVGSSLRNECNGENVFRRASALWVCNSLGEILIAKRSLCKKRDPGKWGPSVTGASNIYDSNYKETILRETEEEIGINLNSFKFRESIKIKGSRYFTQWFIALVDIDISDFILQDQEVDEIKWVSKDYFLREIYNNPKKFVRLAKDRFETIEKFEISNGYDFRV